jgi:lipoate-protein ligase A
MKWKFLNSGENSGKFNMDLDVSLAKNFEHDTAILRLYRWNPYCISLGANQSFEDVDLVKTAADEIDVVKRPTGGRAILHSQELTYSVIYPISNLISVKDIYNELNIALKKGLIIFNPKLSAIELEHKQPNFKEFYKSDLNAICFAVSAKSELNYYGKKLVGSAQRKLGNVILQHGSILCGSYHKKIVEYLTTDEAKKEKIYDEISSTTIDLKLILNYQVDYGLLSCAILKGFENHFDCKIEDNN